MDYVKIVNSKLSVEEISDLVASPSCGAISLFVGTTRDNFDNKQVVQLEYEAYEPMALKGMKTVCEEIRAKWQVENIAIYHRLGIVPVKEASVVIAVSSPHRAESLQAVQFAIDSLKASTPIWKKEVYASEEGSTSIKREIKVEPVETVDDLEPIVPCQIQEHRSAPSDVPPHLIQIKAGSEEITRRINSFIERKREQVNQGNIQDFCFHDGGPENEYSCARVDALLIRRKDSKSHLRVRRVLNTWGPQTRGIDPGSMGCSDPQDPLNALAEPNTSEGMSNLYPGNIKTEPLEEQAVPQGIEERISNAECHLKLYGPIPKDIYTRLKQIEDRILHLEGLSPEYFQFWENMPFEDDFASHRPVKKRMYTCSDLDNKICDLEYKLTMKGHNRR